MHLTHSLKFGKTSIVCSITGTFSTQQRAIPGNFAFSPTCYIFAWPIETLCLTIKHCTAQLPASTAQQGSVAEWLACWPQVQKGLVQITAAMLLGNSIRQTVHTHCASVHQAAKLVATLLRVVTVTAGLAESNGRLPPGLWLMSPAPKAYTR